MLIFSRNDLPSQRVTMKKSLFIILAFALLISGCSTVSLVYRNADWYLQHKINGYTSFTSRQKETIHREVSDYMRWHRKNALPEYITYLQNLNGVAQYQGRLKVEQVTQLRNNLMDLYRKSMVPVIPPAARLLSSLDSRQIQELDRTLAEDSQEHKQEESEGSLDENLDKRAKKTLAFLEWLVGNLNGEQEQKIREMSRRLPLVSPIYIQIHESNQRKLIELLNGHASAEVIAASMSSWILTPEVTRSSQQQRVIQSFETGVDEMIVQIHGLLTPRQKAHLNEMVSAYIKDMRSISMK
jgi:hypothetical protein